MEKSLKQLLLKDLCARLPYNVKVHIKGEYKTPRTIYVIYIENKIVGYFKGFQYEEERIEDVKPYLRSMSSMTEEEIRDYFYECDKDAYDVVKMPRYHGIDWLNKHHFDYRGLIEKDLALEAPSDMYKFND